MQSGDHSNSLPPPASARQPSLFPQILGTTHRQFRNFQGAGTIQSRRLRGQLVSLHTLVERRAIIVASGLTVLLTSMVLEKDLL